MSQIDGIGQTDMLQQAVQIYSMKKAMDSQKSKASAVTDAISQSQSQIQKMSEPHKGQIIDVRV